MDISGNLPQASVHKKRRRPALACEQCRRRKVRCDRNLPCSTCVRSKHALCTYASHTKSAPRKSPEHGAEVPVDSMALALRCPEPILPAFQPLPSPPRRSGASSTAARTQADHRSRIRLAETPEEYPLFAPTPSSGEHSGPADFGTWQPVNGPWAPVTVTASIRADTASTPGSCPGSSSTVNSLMERVKQLEQQLSDLTTRYFGQSHWMNAADTLYRLVNFARKFEGRKNSQLYADLEKCKKLARVIKARRTPSFASITTGQNMPSRELADVLVDIYLRTFESVHRIVHIPTFRADYERYWQNPSEATDTFVILLQLCMGIGATMYDERFTLRTLAIRWFWEGMFWLITPCEKSKMTVNGLQIRCLMHFLRHTANIGCDLSWIGAGAIVRTAMYMGLHRDPKAIVKMSPHRAEMRRRLWATILEIVLQTSIDSGCPPLISTPDYDTEPPANLDDEQLVEDAESVFPVPRDPKVHTQMTVPLALFASFTTRLAIAKRVNEFRSDTLYEETLRHSKELSASLQRMMRQLNSHPAVTSFQLRYVQFMSYRLFFALHQQIIPLALRNPVYYFSRKMTVDTALRLSEAAFLCPDKAGTGPMKPSTPSEVDFYRLIINGAGTYRSVSFQGVMTIGLELINLKEEEANNGPSMSVIGSEAQLRGVLDAVHDWSRRRIQSGETNIKGHALGVVLITHVHGLENGVIDDKIEDYFEAACQERVTECYDLLRNLAGDGVLEEGMDMPHIHDLDMDFDDGTDLLADWDWESMENNMNFGSFPDTMLL
ncbi:Transcription factor yanR [Colletotrichum higginsianum]|uniref:Transcription factor yanR n=1 Tax=Colletotrichum higginsianum TaxID=80884 RepID=A0A4T0W3V8_9PEZI|nr:Transcription factor yanR [Colletotrichum higginsianum]